MQIYWLEQSEARVPPGEQWLSVREREILARLRFPKRRDDWRLGRWTAKLAIAARLGMPQDDTLRDIEVLPSASGAPQAIVAGVIGPVALSISHSNGVGFCALADSGSELGCDVEKVEARSSGFIADYFTLDERELVFARPAEDWNSLLTFFWSAKESALKAIERGLRSDLRSVAVTCYGSDARGTERWQPFGVRHAGERGFRGWWRSADGFVWTVVAAPPPFSPMLLHSAAAAESAVRASTRTRVRPLTDGFTRWYLTRG